MLAPMRPRPIIPSSMLLSLMRFDPEFLEVVTQLLGTLIVNRPYSHERGALHIQLAVVDEHAVRRACRNQ